MVNDTKMDTISNTTMDNKVFMQDQDNNVRRPFTILVEGNVGSGTPVCVVIIFVKDIM